MSFFPPNFEVPIIHNPYTNLAPAGAILTLSFVLQSSWHTSEDLRELSPAAACWQCNIPTRDAVSLIRALNMLGNGNFHGRQVGVLPHLTMLFFCKGGYFSNVLPA